MPKGKVPNTFEDFYPLTDTDALVVTGGESWADSKSDHRDYMRNKYVVRLPYQVRGNAVHLGEITECVASGTHVRLGNYAGSKLCYSDDYKIYHGSELFLRKGEQPFLHDSGLYYTFESEIWKDDVVFIPKFGKFTEVCHPTIYNDWVYFECLLGSAPDGWQVWRQHMTTNRRERVLLHGANPYCFEGYLYFSWWTSFSNLLNTKRIKL